MARHSTLQRDTMPRRMLKGKVSRQRGHSFQYRATCVSCPTAHKNDHRWFQRHDALHQATSSPIIACICLDELLLNSIEGNEAEYYSSGGCGWNEQEQTFRATRTAHTLNGGNQGEKDM